MPKIIAASILKKTFTTILVLAGCAVAFNDVPGDALGVTLLFALIVLLPTAVFFFGIRSVAGIVVVGTLLLGMDVRAWLTLQDVPVGEEIGAGLGAFANSIYSLGIAVVGAALDWVGRAVFARSPGHLRRP